MRHWLLAQFYFFLWSSCSAQTNDESLESNTTDTFVTASGVGNWTEEEVEPKFYSAVATSDSGQYIYALAEDYVLMSSDFGKEWHQTDSPFVDYFSDVATNSSGQRVYALNNPLNPEDATLYISDDYGASWTSNFGLEPLGGYVSIACNSVGDVVYVAGFSTDVHVSMDGGNTWRSSDSFLADATVFQVVTDTTGQNATLVSGDSTNSIGGVYSSTDYGLSWFRQDLDNGVNQYTGVRMSSDGKTVMVVDNLVRGGMYKSTNYGFDLTQVTTAPNITVTDFASSDDLEYLMTRSNMNNESSYFSSDGGLTWYLTQYVSSADSFDKSFNAIASSSTGQLMVGVIYGGMVLTYQPECPLGYQHAGFDAEADPDGNNLCFYCDDGYYGAYTDSGDSINCYPCQEGTYSSEISAFESSSCSECPSLYSTVDDASTDKSDCHVFEINLPATFQWILYSVGFMWFLLILYYATRPHRLRSSEKNVFLAVFLALIFPFLDLCTDVAYLAISPFYHVSMFVICVICFMHPVILFVIRLYELRALPTSVRYIWWLSYDMSAGGDEADEQETTENDSAVDDSGVKEGTSGDFIPYPTITLPLDENTLKTSRFTLIFAFDTHDNILTISFEIIVWMVAITLQLLTVIVLPIFLIMWLFVGMTLQLTQTITLSATWNIWYFVWTGTNKFADIGPGGVDTEDLNYGILSHFLLEAVPGLILQAINNTLMRSWTKDSVAVISIVMSILVCISVLYKYLYHSKINADPVGVRNIPVDRSIRVRIMFLSVDWSVLDAKLPAYAKRIKCFQNDDVKSRCSGREKSDLERSLLDDDNKKYIDGKLNDCEHESDPIDTYIPVKNCAVAQSDVSSLSSAGVGSGMTDLISNKLEVSERLTLMFSTTEHISGNINETRDNFVTETPMTRMLDGAGVPFKLQSDQSLEHMDAAIIIELFVESSSITAFIEEMSKFEVPRIISSKLFVYLKSIVKSMKE